MVQLLLVGLLLFAVAMAIAFALTLRVAVNWAKEFEELKNYGAEATGRVTEKRQRRQRGTTSTWIRYEYTDQFGATHRSRRNIVTPEAWDAHSEGGPIAIVYSQRSPKISAPQYLMNMAPRSGS